MRTWVNGVIAVVVGLGLISAAKAEGKKAAKKDKGGAHAIVEKAIKARAGNEKAGQKAATWKVKGKVFIQDNEFELDGTWFLQGPNQYKLEAKGGTFDIVMVVNGDKAWRKVNDDTKELEEKELAEQKGQAYFNYVTTLLPLNDKAFHFSPLGTVKVDDKDAEGVTVKHEGQKDINLFFDSKSGQLVKSETKSTRRDNEVTVEVVYKDYKDMGGVKRPSKVITKMDGKTFTELEISDFKTIDKLPDSTFNQP